MSRRLIGLPFAAAAVLVSLAACEIDVSPGSMPAPFSIAPIPSASETVPAYVCTVVYKILTDGAMTLAGEYGAGAQKLRDTLNDMAAQVTAEQAKAGDPALRSAIQGVATSLSTGAQSADPKAYVQGDFSTVGQKLDTACP